MSGASAASSRIRFAWVPREAATRRDRKSTRLNSSHTVISYAVFCLKKKKKYTLKQRRDENEKLTLRGMTVELYLHPENVNIDCEKNTNSECIQLSHELQIISIVSG